MNDGLTLRHSPRKGDQRTIQFSSMRVLAIKRLHSTPVWLSFQHGNWVGASLVNPLYPKLNPQFVPVFPNYIYIIYESLCSLFIGLFGGWAANIYPKERKSIVPFPAEIHVLTQSEQEPENLTQAAAAVVRCSPAKWGSLDNKTSLTHTDTWTHTASSPACRQLVCPPLRSNSIASSSALRAPPDPNAMPDKMTDRMPDKMSIACQNVWQIKCLRQNARLNAR